MRRLLLIILLIVIKSSSFGQTAEDLNRKSKEFLQQQDFKSAVPLLKLSAEDGNAQAQYNYGICYQQGIAVPKNDSIANEWFLNSAKQGWKDAQFKIAYSYATGRGLSKDEKKAIYWSIKCADQQDTECMLDVVTSYFNGFGTRKNIDSAIIWATRLALLNNPEELEPSGRITSSRANLAMMYWKGQYISKDLKKSSMWFLIYNENKRDFSFIDQQQNIDNIKEVEKQLTLTDKEEAISDAEKLLNHKLANLDNLFKPDLR